jgi:hypothetical protein
MGPSPLHEQGVIADEGIVVWPRSLFRLVPEAMDGWRTEHKPRTERAPRIVR